MAKYKTLITSLKEIRYGIILKIGAGILLDVFIVFPQWYKR